VADTKISALTALTGANVDTTADLLAIVDTSATQTKKITIDELRIPVGVPVGAVSAYAGATAPDGWLLCYGQAVSRTTYSALFTAISTTYGTGDGSTTFNLPDLRGRVVAGQDDMGGSSANRLTNQSGGLDGDTLGATGGAETHTLTTAEMPAHTHATASRVDGTLGSSQTFQQGAAQQSSVATDSKGGDGAHNNVQPTIVLNYIIKT
jgi:microcystin-dependent protein